MRLEMETAEIFVPDGRPKDDALVRTTHLAVGAHPDDVEMMAYHGILACFERDDRSFCGVVMTDGAACPRSGLYADYSDEQMRSVRRGEQKKAATVGGYGAQVMLDYPSSAVKDPANAGPVEDLARVLTVAAPEFVYTHSPTDGHDTHVATALRVIEAVRRLPAHARPRRVYGCELWRALDWLVDEDKVAFDVTSRESLQSSLIGVFDSQVSGGKRYDLAALGRGRANATYYASHEVDDAERMSLAMDLTSVAHDADSDVDGYVQGLIARFAGDVAKRLARLR